MRPGVMCKIPRNSLALCLLLHYYTNCLPTHPPTLPTYVPAYLPTYIHTPTSHIHTCMHTYVHAYMRTVHALHTCIHMCMHNTCSIHVFIHNTCIMHTYIHTYIYTHIYIYIHMYKLRPSAPAVNLRAYTSTHFVRLGAQHQHGFLSCWSVVVCLQTVETMDSLELQIFAHISSEQFRRACLAIVSS